MIWTLSIVTVLFSVISIYYHAAQPLNRLMTGTIRGDRMPLVPASTLERSGLWTDVQSLAVYTEVVETIRQESKPDETLLVIPNNPELYFLADRKNPFRFWNSAIGVRDATEAAEVINTLQNTPPRVVVISPADRNNTATSNEIVTYVKDHYSLIKTVSGFEIYRAPVARKAT